MEKQWKYLTELDPVWDNAFVIPFSWQEDAYMQDKGEQGWELCIVVSQHENNPEIRTSWIYYWRKLVPETL